MLNNASTAATAFVIQPKAGAKGDGRSRNVSGVGAALRHSDRVVWWFNTNGATLTIRDMILERTAGSAVTIAVETNGGSMTLERCVVEARGTATGVNVSGNQAFPFTIHDSVVYGHTTLGIDCRLSTDQSVIGNTVVPKSASGTYGILPSVGSTNGTVANNISVNHPTEDYFNTSTNVNHGSNLRAIELSAIRICLEPLVPVSCKIQGIVNSSQQALKSA